MTEDELKRYSINEIIYDLKAILNCFQISVNNNLGAAVYVGLIPYLYSFIYAGLEYLERYQFITIDDKEMSKKVKTLRSKFQKQYAQIKSTKSLEEFIDSEYKKFLELHNQKTSSPQTGNVVNNYYVADLNDKPIDNYHLASSLFDFEIGSYVPIIVPQLSSHIGELLSIIKYLLTEAGVDLTAPPSTVTFDEIKYADINITRNYINFGIQNNPAILMAFLDILCVLNSYNEVFTRINSDVRLDFKVKFLVLFDSITATAKMIEYCENNHKNLKFGDEDKDFIFTIKEKYCKNQLRRACAHYDFSPEREHWSQKWEADPIVELFEGTFHKEIDVISNEFDEILKELSERLNRFVIRKPFADAS